MKAKGPVILCIVLVAIAAAGVRPLHGYWLTSGVAVCTATGMQEYHSIVSDSDDGAILVWQDFRSSTEYDIYAQRIAASGNALWSPNGVSICGATQDQGHPALIPDGTGGAFIVWEDYRNGSGADIYAQRINADGAVLWVANGIPICTATADQVYPAIAPDGAGGAIIVWQDARSGGNDDIYAQRVNAAGVVQWATHGEVVCAAAGIQRTARIISDGAGGAVIVWQDGRNMTDWNLYAQRIDGAGKTEWGAADVAVCTSANVQQEHVVVPDGAGGACITWRDFRSGASDVYAQRVDASGTPLWTPNGIVVCDAAYAQDMMAAIADGGGGIYIAWRDQRTLSDYYLYAQRINSSGGARWTPNGIPVSSSPMQQGTPGLAPDHAGGVIVAYYQMDPGSLMDMYAQRIDSSGNAQWDASGIAVCAAAEDQWYPVLAADDAGGAIIAWQDARGTSLDIYAHRIGRDGCLGYLCPEIDEVLDAPNDEGGWVRVHVPGTLYDTPMSPYPVTGYNIWRMIEEGGALMASRRPDDMPDGDGEAIASRFLTDPEAALGTRISGAAATALGLPPGSWESIGFHAATQEVDYDFLVPTKTDSTESGTHREIYVVTAHTVTPSVYYASEPDSGYSVDNLAPGPPEGVLGERRHMPEGLQLSWNQNTEQDLWHYRVYRGTSEDFAPAPGNRIASPTEPQAFDDEWRWNSDYYYKVSAVDIHGNESGHALLRPEDVTGDETPRAPEDTYLAQNFPNPFNPATKIAFGLAVSGRVRLRIYDASGRLVRALVDETRPAGHYIEPWDGRDAHGIAAASGVYFYQLEAGAFTETRKMVLLR
jgi:hypothetical protein